MARVVCSTLPSWPVPKIPVNLCTKELEIRWFQGSTMKHLQIIQFFQVFGRALWKNVELFQKLLRYHPCPRKIGNPLAKNEPIGQWRWCFSWPILRLTSFWHLGPSSTRRPRHMLKPWAASGDLSRSKKAPGYHQGIIGWSRGAKAGWLAIAFGCQRWKAEILTGGHDRRIVRDSHCAATWVFGCHRPFFKNEVTFWPFLQWTSGLGTYHGSTIDIHRYFMVLWVHMSIFFAHLLAGVQEVRTKLALAKAARSWGVNPGSRSTLVDWAFLGDHWGSSGVDAFLCSLLWEVTVIWRRSHHAHMMCHCLIVSQNLLRVKALFFYPGFHTKTSSVGIMFIPAAKPCVLTHPKDSHDWRSAHVSQNVHGWMWSKPILGGFKTKKAKFDQTCTL